MKKTPKKAAPKKSKTKLPPTPGMGARRPSRPPTPAAPPAPPAEPMQTIKVPARYFSIKARYVVMKPPMTEFDKCPRCDGKHKKLKPKKFLKPMQFFDYDKDGKPELTSQASYWVKCPKTKEPVILFDRVDTGETVANCVLETVQENAVKDICEAEDKRILDELKSYTETKTPTESIITATYKGKGKKGKWTAKATISDTQAWVYDPNAPGRIVPGTKAEAKAQRARVKAQEAAVKKGKGKKK